MIDILCVSVHPDDVEMSMGGSILLFKSLGYRVGVLDLTNGEPTPFGTVKTRMAERDRASELLGLDQRITLDLPNRILADTIEGRVQVAQVYRELQPSILFVHYPDDLHPDHVAGSRISEDARFHAKLTKTDMRGEPHFAPHLFYHNAIHKRLMMKPAFVLDVSSFFDKKLEVCRCYDSQFHTEDRKIYMENMLRGSGMFYGNSIRARFGEPFYSSEPLGLTNLNGFIGFKEGVVPGLEDVRKWASENPAKTTKSPHK